MKPRAYFISAILLTIIPTGCFKGKSSTEKTKENMNKIETGTILNLNDFTKTKEGILYQILKPGFGSKPLKGETVTVHYTGWLLQGTNTVGKKFDSSVDRGPYFNFTIYRGQVIAGWDLSVGDMNIGEKRLVILPAQLAYGNRSAGPDIKPNSTLIFEIELFKSM